MRAIFDICKFCKFFVGGQCLQPDKIVGDDGTCKKFSLSPKYKVTRDEISYKKEKN